MLITSPVVVVHARSDLIRPAIHTVYITVVLKIMSPYLIHVNIEHVSYPASFPGSPHCVQLRVQRSCNNCTQGEEPGNKARG